MTKFNELNIGDMFNSMIARYVKTDDKHAIVVMSSMLDIGTIMEFSDEEVIVLWSSKGE